MDCARLFRPPDANCATREASGWNTDEPQPISATASKIGKKSGAKGGRSRTRSKDIPASKKRTIEDLKALGCTGNLNPENPVLNGVDIDKLYDYVKAHSELQNLSLYKAAESYQKAVRESLDFAQANRQAPRSGERNL